MFVINTAISNLAIITATTVVVSKLLCRQGRQKRVLVPVEYFFCEIDGAGLLQILTPNRKYWLANAVQLGLILKRLICTVDK